ncbi:MAG TPA: hypothetical protein VFB99_03810 [Vicinamibacterales bacterium]|nr:hypothetical protein [Vicinamibacterales bacterium]
MREPDLGAAAARVDVGSFWAKPGNIFAGFEWQYWDNKFGIDDLNESMPQILVKWVLTPTLNPENTALTDR